MQNTKKTKTGFFQKIEGLEAKISELGQRLHAEREAHEESRRQLAEAQAMIDFAESVQAEIRMDQEAGNAAPGLTGLARASAAITAQIRNTNSRGQAPLV